MSAIVDKSFLWATLQTPHLSLVRTSNERPWSSCFAFIPLTPDIPEEFRAQRPIPDPPEVKAAVGRLQSFVDRLWAELMP